MAKVTSRYQVTVPKTVADQYAIKPGDEIDWIPAGESIRVVKRLSAKRKPVATAKARLRRFDEASARQCQRDKAVAAGVGTDRGWTREDLYRRGRFG